LLAKQKKTAPASLAEDGLRQTSFGYRSPWKGPTMDEANVDPAGNQAKRPHRRWSMSHRMWLGKLALQEQMVSVFSRP
jgi:hypothetical protein